MTKEELLKLNNHDIIKLYMEDPITPKARLNTLLEENVFLLGFLYARWLLVKDDK